MKYRGEQRRAAVYAALEQIARRFKPEEELPPAAYNITIDIVGHVDGELIGMNTAGVLTIEPPYYEEAPGEPDVEGLVALLCAELERLGPGVLNARLAEMIGHVDPGGRVKVSGERRLAAGYLIDSIRRAQRTLKRGSTNYAPKL